ncbi:uncharacterized protein LOC110225468 [Arabidopsis lyrata subsp. lyrata]|nr:uncharacterized protein LOC110225468 [Arabidopsis lyrata subsp. lyrata]|eukprot:XP_020870954.1 uncharacterized protein LOC110225468 [Arabidopsis lyrata subsp. lyrata]
MLLRLFSTGSSLSKKMFGSTLMLSTLETRTPCLAVSAKFVSKHGLE